MSTGPNDDQALAKVYWEEVWIEGIISPVFDAIKSQYDTKKGRRPVVLASETDVKISIQSNTFLPIDRLYGVIDDRLSKSAQFGIVRPRVRESLARSLSSRLQFFSNRALVVVGANNVNDLALLFDTFEDYPIRGLKVIVVSESELDFERVQNLVDIIQVKLSVSAFLKEIKKFGAPSSEQVTENFVRYGDKMIQITGEIRDFIEKEFIPICENDLVQQRAFSLDDFMDFLDGSLENWSGFSVGMPVQRDYVTNEGRSFYDELSRTIEQAIKFQDKITNYFIEIPTEGGAGSTTLIRSAVFNCAFRGFPVLLFKPIQTDYTLDKLHAYINSVIELGIGSGITEPLPFIIVFDKPQSSISNIKQLPSYMGIRGKKIIVIHLTDALDTALYDYEQRGGFIRLPKLIAKASENEIVSCAKKFNEIVEFHSLPIQVPSIENWFDIESSQTWKSNTAELQIDSLFWVALRFFYTEGLDTFTADVARDNLGKWIAERYRRVKD